MEAREARPRGDARSALAAGRTLQNDARKELDTRKDAGLDVRGLEARYRAAAGDLDAAQQIDAGASEALDHAKRLPDLRRQADQKAKAVAAMEQSTAAELDRVRRSGARWATSRRTGGEHASRRPPPVRTWAPTTARPSTP